MEEKLNLDHEQVCLYSIDYKPSLLTEASLLLLSRTIERLIEHYQRNRDCQAVRFVEARSITKPPWQGIISNNSRYWRVKSGISIKASGPLPRRATVDEIVGEDNQPPDPRRLPELVKKFEPPPIALCISPEDKIKRFEPDAQVPNPTSTFLGSGGCSVFLVPDVQQFLNCSREVFAPGIQEDFADEAFYVPQFQLNDWTSASQSDLSCWFAHFGLYIGELGVEGGCVIAAQEPLDQFLTDLTAFNHQFN